MDLQKLINADFNVHNLHIMKKALFSIGVHEIPITTCSVSSRTITLIVILSTAELDFVIIFFLA